MHGVRTGTVKDPRNNHIFSCELWPNHIKGLLWQNVCSSSITSFTVATNTDRPVHVDWLLPQAAKGERPGLCARCLLAEVRQHGGLTDGGEILEQMVGRVERFQGWVEWWGDGGQDKGGQA